MYLYSHGDVADKANLRPLGRHGFPRRDFHPLGIEYHSPSDTVYAVNHAAYGPSIEIFKLTPTREHLIWERTFEHPSLHAPNAIAAINEHELFVTNDHYFLARTFKPLSLIETYLGIPLGSVVYVNLKTNEVKTLARVPFANGVELLNSTHLAVASSTTPGVRVYKIDAESKALQLVQFFKTPFAADNLSVDSKGKLLVAGHPFAPALAAVAEQNHKFNLDGKDDSLRPESERPRSPSWVAEWDGNGNGTLKNIYVGQEYGCGCTALRDNKRKLGIITGLYEKGILVWKD